MLQNTASVGGKWEDPKLQGPDALETKSFKSTATVASGAGFCCGSFFFAQGQDFRPSQQLIACPDVAHDFGDSAATDVCIWDNWITSPMNSAMIDLKSITAVRVRSAWENSNNFPHL